MKFRHNITLNNDILKIVTEEQILYYYLHYDYIKGNVSSPLRLDEGPSFNIKKQGDTIRCKDFGGEGFSGNLYDLLGKLYNKTYLEILEMLYKDLSKIKKSPETIFATKNTAIYNTTKTKNSKKNVIQYSLDIVIRDWKDYDLQFWEDFGISLPFLTNSNTYAISHIIITEDNVKKTIPAEKYAYAYAEFKDGKTTYKIYQPFSKEHKWINKHDPSVWDLWNKLPKSNENLIITSSRKDALSIWENTGIPSISLQAESYYPKIQIMAELKSRFKNIYVLFDNDIDKPINYGLKFATKLCSEFDLKLILIPNNYQTKDPSDFCKKYGRKKLKNLIITLIKQINNGHNN